MSRFRAVLAAVLVFACFTSVPISVRADDSLTPPRVPPDPTPDQVEQNLPQLGNPLNQPVTGASEDPLMVGTEPPPSLEALQATRPGDERGDGLEPA
jgi:defect in organelle trafficking protein DotC